MQMYLNTNTFEKYFKYFFKYFSFSRYIKDISSSSSSLLLLSKLSGYIQWSSIYLATAQCSVFTLAEFTISQIYTAETSAAGKCCL